MFTTKVVTAVAAGVLSAAVTGAVAFAAFQPPSASAMVASTDTGAVTAAHAEKGGDALPAILAKLVTNGTITQAQADAIVGAVRTAAEEAREKAKEKLQERKDKAKERDGDRIAAELLKRVLGNMLKQSVEYIGLPHEAVAAQLKAGKSLAEIAQERGETKAELVSALVAKANAKIDAAAANGALTAEALTKAKDSAKTLVEKIVDAKRAAKPASPPKPKRP